MSDAISADSLRKFMRQLGSRARGDGRIYITDGGSAVLRGWRATTIDIDIRTDPEPAGAFEAIPRIKRELQLNVELASPQDFLPPLPDRSRGQRGLLPL